MSSFFASKPAPTLDLHCLQILCSLEIECGRGLAPGGVPTKASVAAPHDYQDFLAFSYSGMTFGIAACKEAIRLDDAG